MADKKHEGHAPGDEIIQRYRFRVRTSDGRELVSHIATVTRPALPIAPQPASDLVVSEEVAARSPAAPAALTMADVPVHQILVAVKGSKQGDLKPSPGFKDQHGTVPHHQFATEEFHFATTSPRDPASGQPTGQRMHTPVTFVMALGPATPQLYMALATNEVLPIVVFDCYGTDKGGKLALAHSVKLTNASVASIGFHQPNCKDPAQTKYDGCEEVALTFEKIELTNGAVTAVEEWAPSGA